MDDHVTHPVRLAERYAPNLVLFALFLASCGPSDSSGAKERKIAELGRLGARVVTDDAGAAWSLHARGTSISDADLAGIEVCSNLRHVDLTDTDVSDAGIAELAKIETIEKLYLSQTRVGDRALSSIAKLHNLVILDLSQTEVGDEGLLALTPLARLEHLNLTGTSCTASGVEEAKMFLPECRIVLEPANDEGAGS